MRKIEFVMRNGAGTNTVPFLQRIEKNTDTSVGSDLFSRAASSRVSSALMSLTAVFGMGTGGPSSLQPPTVSVFFFVSAPTYFPGPLPAEYLQH